MCIGALLLFIAISSFLTYTWEYLGPVGRLAIGVIGGFLLLSIGERTRGKVERWFTEGSTGSGLAIFYLTLWVGAQRYGIVPYPIASISMVVTTALGVYLAPRYDALSLCVLATIGGFLTLNLWCDASPKPECPSNYWWVSNPDFITLHRGANLLSKSRFFHLYHPTEWGCSFSISL